MNVKAKGEFPSSGNGNTGIGKTLEDAIGVEENNSDAPDMYGFEIKSQRTSSSSYVTLFTKAPTYPKAVNNHLRLTYGSADSNFPDIKVLHTSIFESRWNTHSARYGYKLKRDDDLQKLFLLVTNLAHGTLEESNIYWTYDVLGKILTEKLNNLAFIQADVRKQNSKEFFTFKKCSLFYDVSLERFLACVSADEIMFDIRIGAYKTPNLKNYGKSHDHGSGFRIRKEKFINLYDGHCII